MNRRFFIAAMAGAMLPRGAAGQHAHPPVVPSGSQIQSRELPAGTRPHVFPDEPPFTRPLRLPGASGMMAAVATGSPLEFRAKPARLELLQGRDSELLVYECEVAGRAAFNPTLLARTGQELRVRLENHLGEDSTIHWHGLHVDEKNDGSGMHPVRHGENYDYRFTLRNRAALYWYHPHPHSRTGFQVHQGMGGLLIVRDDEDDGLSRSLGTELGKSELAMLVQDKQVDERNRLKYSMGEDDWIGNRLMVNWTSCPRHDVQAGLLRLRLLNGSNARVYRLAFESRGRKLPFHLIGTDGGLLEKPRKIQECFFAPAQRLDLVLDLRSLATGDQVVMKSLAYDPMEHDAREGVLDPKIEHPGAPMMGEAMDLMRLDVSGRTTRLGGSIPSRLSEPFPRFSGRMVERSFRVHADKTRWLLNGTNYHEDMHRVSFTVKGRAPELWTIRNELRSMPHPFHVHGFHFRVLRRIGSPAQVKRLAVDNAGRGAQDLGWLDTVLVWPGEAVRIAVDFSPAAEGLNHYMFHCHNLEHEDQGLMLNFAVAA